MNLTEKAEAPPAAPPRPAPPQLRGLGTVLIERGWVRPDEVESAAQEGERTGERLGSILVRRGRVTDTQLAQALAIAYQMPWTELEETEVDLDAIRAGTIPFELAETYQILPLRTPAGLLHLGMADPARIEVIDLLRKKGVRVAPVIVPASRLTLILSRIDPEDSRTKINRLIARAQVAGIDAEEGPILQLARALLTHALQVGASDVHVEPDRSTVRVRFRLDGVLTQTYTFPGSVHQALVNAIKIAAGMDIAVKHLPQDGKLIHEALGRAIDVRIATFPGVWGENVVLRLLDKLTALRPLEAIGFTDRLLDAIRGILVQPHGLFLVTGPTGSGKTTTLYACLTRLPSTERSVMTIEDPVEYELSMVKQAQADDKAGFTFQTALRSMLRADPDIVFVGEIRDGETAELACQAALTGHLVFSTLHTNSAPEAISRLLELKVQRHVLAAALRGTIAQRLVRRICLHCSTRRPPTAHERRLFEEAAIDIDQVPEAVGCERCRGTGYRDRIAIAEYFCITPRIQDGIALGEGLGALVVHDPDYQPLAVEGLRKVAAGVTTVAEILRVAEWRPSSRT